MAGQRKLLGKILEEMHVCTPVHIKNALKVQMQDPGKKLGEILVEQGVTNAAQVTEALARQFDFPYVDLANLKIWTAGGNSLHVFDTKKGAFDFLIWGSAQGGRWGVQDHSAYAVFGEAGYQPKIPPQHKTLARLKPWFRGGYSVSSGDENPADRTHGTAR